MFGLSEKTITYIHAILKKYPSITKAVIYGSRAMGNYKAGSDIDLTLFGVNLTLSELLNIYDELDDSFLPYTFDISIFDDLKEPDLKEHITQVGKIFYSNEV